MKKNLFFAIMLLAATAMAQIPKGFSFQGVARDGQGQVLANKTTIQVEFTLYQQANKTGEIWKEVKTVATDAYGVFSTTIGNGTNQTPSGELNFLKLDFTKQLWVAIRVDIGTGFSPVGDVTALQTVPYAMIAQNVVNETDPLFNASAAKNIKPADTTRWNNKSTFSGNYTDLSGKPTNISTFANDKNYLIAEADPSFNASPAKNIKATDTTRWNNKSTFSGNYADLSGKPTNVGTFANDKNYLTTETDPTFNASVLKNVKAADTTRWAADKQQLSLTGSQLSIANANAVDLSSLFVSSSFKPQAQTQLSGKVSTSIGSTFVTGDANAAFTKELTKGSVIRIRQNTTDVYFKVDSVYNDAKLRISKASLVDQPSFTDYYTEGVMMTVLNNTGDTTFQVTPQGRLKDKTGFVMPVGTIIAFGGETVPEGWLRCDGSILKQSDYPELYAAIGTTWGYSTSDDFRIPYTYGMFLRGWDKENIGWDKDVANRTEYSNFKNRSGNHVGSFQYDAFKNHDHGGGDHTHSITDPGHNHGIPGHITSDGSWGGDFGGGAMGGGTSYYLWRNTLTNTKFTGITGTNKPSTTVIQPNGGSETRPVNVYVNYIIKY